MFIMYTKSTYHENTLGELLHISVGCVDAHLIIEVVIDFKLIFVFASSIKSHIAAL